MKTKPNFTYKEFIQKLTNVQIKKSDNNQSKSPRVLKSHNKNVSTQLNQNNDCQKIFQKKTQQKDNEIVKKSFEKTSPSKLSIKQNDFSKDLQNYGPDSSLKNTTNKLKLKNNSGTNKNNTTQNPSSKKTINSTTSIGQYPFPGSTKNLHNQSVRQQTKKVNFNQNQSNYFMRQNNKSSQKHLESCSTFRQNYGYENQEQPLTTGRGKNSGRSPSLKKSNSRINVNNMNGKHSTSINSNSQSKINYKKSSIKSINDTNNISSTNNRPKFKLNSNCKSSDKPKPTNYNNSITDRINTHYQFNRSQHQNQECCKINERVNTQYYDNRSKLNMNIKQSPSFYHQKSMMEDSNFLDFGGDNSDLSHSSLFHEDVALFNNKNCQQQSKIKKPTININLSSSNLNNTSQCHNKSTASLSNNHQVSQQHSFMNQKSYEHLYNNFITSISQKLFTITKLSSQSQLLAHKIKYIEYLQCLKQMNLIKNDYQPYQQHKLPNQVDLVRQMWQELIAGHNVNHFIIIIAIILKITPIQKINQNSNKDQEDDSISESNCKEFGQFIYLQKKYEQFRLTRLQITKAKVYSEKDSLQYYNYPFQPTISKNSQQIASTSVKNKSRLINCSNNQSLRQQFHNSSLNKQTSLRQNQNHQNISITTQLGPITTHDYQNSNFSGISFVSPRTNHVSGLGNKRSQILYQEGKKKSLEKRQAQDKSTIDYEYEKNMEQLTFKPKITIKRKKPEENQNCVSLLGKSQVNNSMTKDYISPRFVQQEQKTINRMIRGRVQRQVKQITIERGLPYNQKTIQKLRRQKFQQIMKQHQQSRLKLCASHLNHNMSQSQLTKNKSSLNDPANSNLSISPNKGNNSKNNQQMITKQQNSHQRCTTQVQNLQNLMDLSFQQLNLNNDENQKSEKQIINNLQESYDLFGNLNDNKNQIIHEQVFKASSDYKNNNQSQDDYNVIDNSDLSPQDYFTLDIYYQEDKSDKLRISKDSSIQQMYSQAQKFVKKHNLSKQMQIKLKQQLTIAMRCHDIQKIQENDEEQQCSLLM